MNGKKAGKGKTAAKGKRAVSDKGIGLEVVLEVQKRWLRRYLAHTSIVTQQLSDGHFQVSSWLGACTEIWKGLADDMHEMATVMLRNAGK